MESRSTNPVDWRSLDPIVGASSRQTWMEIAPDRRSQLEQAVPGAAIAGIVSPNIDRELAAVVAECQRNRWRMLPCGQGSKLDWGGLVQADVVISSDRLNRLIEHAIGDLTVTVEAGMPFAELQAILATAGQFLAIDPAYPERATIGGIVATADTGSLRQRYNSVRDMVLGLSFVRSDGQIAKAGGRVVKNVAGYDLMKLFTGSYGTLGIVSQVTLRVYPLPEASQTLVLSGEAPAIAQAARSLLNSALTPARFDLLSESLVKQAAIGKGTGLAINFQSIAPSVQEQSKRVQELGQTLGLTCTDFQTAEEADLWRRLREPTIAAPPKPAIACKIGVRPASAITVLEKIGPSDHWTGQIHAASGLGTLTFSEVTPAALRNIRALLQANGGFLSLLQAPIALKQQLDVWGYSGNAIDLMRTLKHQFDPYALLSPSRFLTDTLT